MRKVDHVVIRHKGQEYWGLPMEEEIEETIFAVVPHMVPVGQSMGSNMCMSGANCRGQSDHPGRRVAAAEYDIMTRRPGGRKQSNRSYCRTCIEEMRHLAIYREHLDSADEIFRQYWLNKEKRAG